MATPEIVAQTFVRQYYEILNKSPENLHKFYKDDSVLKWPGFELVTTLKEIDEKIMASGYPGCEIKIAHLDAQDSMMDGIIVNISGCLIGDDGVKRVFTQMFFLAKQERGFYVKNDSFCVLDTKEIMYSFGDESHETEEEVISPAVAESSSIASTEGPVAQPEPETVVTAEAFPPISIVEKTRAVTVAIPEAPKEAAPVAPVASSEKPEVEAEPKKFSWASLVAKESKVPPEYSGPKIVSVGVTFNHQSDGDRKPTTFNKTKEQAGPKNAAYNDPALSRTVYVRDLPKEITKPELADALKKFGQVKLDSVQKKDFDDGFSFGFVEFESEAMAKAAVQARSVMINGQEAHISFKKSKAANNGPRPAGGFRGKPFQGNQADNGAEPHSNGGGRGQGRGGAERPKRDFGFRNNGGGGRAPGAAAGEGRW